jgi:arylformamidase
MKIIDLSILLRKGSLSLVPGHPEFELEDFHFHDRDFRSNSYLKISTHTGTHIDAPFHFVSGGTTIDDLPLENTVGQAVLVDLRDITTARKGFSTADLKGALKGTDIGGKIVVLHSGWIKEKWATPEMYGDNPYLLEETAEWMVTQKIKCVGLDFSLDNPDQGNLPLEKKFPIHRTFLGNEIPHIENLCNLELIDQEEFLMVALPLKLYSCNGAPARAIAILD